MIAQRGHRVVHRRVPGDHDDRQGRRGPAQRLQQLQAVHARHLHVGQHQVPALRAGPLQRDGRVLGMRDVEAAAVGQQPAEQATGHRVVVDDQDPPRRFTVTASRHAPVAPETVRTDRLFVAKSYVVTTIRDNFPPGYPGPGPPEAHPACPRDVADVDLLQQRPVPVVVGVERAQGHLVAAPRGGGVAERVVGPAEGERREPEARVGIERAAQRGRRRGRAARLQADQAVDEMRVGVERVGGQQRDDLGRGGVVVPLVRRLQRRRQPPLPRHRRLAAQRPPQRPGRRPARGRGRLRVFGLAARGVGRSRDRGRDRGPQCVRRAEQQRPARPDRPSQ